jgi:hypothetical protein
MRIDKQRRSINFEDRGRGIVGGMGHGGRRMLGAVAEPHAMAT